MYIFMSTSNRNVCFMLPLCRLSSLFTLQKGWILWWRAYEKKNGNVLLSFIEVATITFYLNWGDSYSPPSILRPLILVYEFFMLVLKSSRAHLDCVYWLHSNNPTQINLSTCLNCMIFLSINSFDSLILPRSTNLIRLFVLFYSAKGEIRHPIAPYDYPTLLGENKSRNQN